MSIEFALEEDIPQIVALSYKSFEESQMQEYKCHPDFDKSLVFLANAVIKEMVFVKRNEQDQRLIDGMYVGTRGTAWWCSEVYLSTNIFYIKPEYRSFKLAKLFVTAAKEYAIIKELPLVFDLFTQKDVEKKKKLFKFLGFEEYGSILAFNFNKG